MKKTLLLLVAMFAMVFSASAQTNLLTNGDFETWTDGAADNWKTATTAGNATLSQSMDAHGGQYAMFVSGATKNKRLAYKETAFEAGTYTLTFWAKGTKCKPGIALIDDEGKLNSNNGYKYVANNIEISSTEWTEVSHEFTLDSDTTICILIMNPKDCGDLIVDDVCLVKASAGEEGGEEGGEETPDTPATPTSLWAESFATSQGDFTINDVLLPEGSTYVWKFDSYGYMKASAYVNKTNLPSESWLISPAFDFSKATKLSLSFQQAGNYFKSQENLLAACKVMVKEVGTEEWTALTLDANPEGTSWTWVTSTTDLSAYVGKKAQIAFVYTSTADIAGTWEVKDFQLNGEGEVSLAKSEEPVVVIDGIAALKAEAVGKHTVKLTDAIVTYINGNNFYMEDANAGINGYMKGHGLVAGQKINGEVVVTTSTYGGAVQMGSIELGSATVTDGAEIPCTEVTVAELVQNGAKYENMRVKVANATLTTAFVAAAEGVTQNRNGEIEQDGSTVAIYQKDKNAVFEVAAGSMVDVVGYPGFYNGAFQLNVWEAADITAVVPEGISNITLNGNAVIYSIDGRRLAQPVKGINIINGKKVYVK